jgi:hypothetical protein
MFVNTYFLSFEQLEHTDLVHLLHLCSLFVKLNYLVQISQFF